MLISTSASLGRVQHTREWLGRTKEKDTLVVRMEDFKADDSEQVIELNCSDKHIFHVKCLQ